MGGNTTNSTHDSSTKDGSYGSAIGNMNKGSGICSNSLRYKADQRRALNIYTGLLASYKELPQRSEALANAKITILRYKPGRWIGKGSELKPSGYILPETTAILLIGPKGSGKSSLINRISTVFEYYKFGSDRAQVSSYHSSVKERGTYFLSEYTVPRTSNDFCLFDTRSTSDDLFENIMELNHWMKNGVRHGEPVIRDSDTSKLKCRMKSKNLQMGKVRMVNSVVMVVNALSVLESMTSGDPEKKQYTEMVANTFKLPCLQFKDDKPAIVVTHGDLLTIADRVKVRIYLGELLGIPPKTQIFDIPESNDLVTELAIVDLLHHCLEHADSNLPLKGRHTIKVHVFYISVYLLLLLVMVIGISLTSTKDSHCNYSR